MKNKFVLRLMCFIGFCLFVSPNYAKAQNFLDVMYSDGREVPYEEIVDYAQNIPSETSYEHGTGFESSSLSSTSIIDAVDGDNREVVNRNEQPYHSVVKLHMTFPNGWATASGSFISKDTILTVAHNLYNDMYGGWATKIYVQVVGENRFKEADYYMVPRAYYGIDDVQWGGHDIGAIKLKENTGEINGWFGLTQEISNPVTLTGFHKDLPYDMQTETNNSLIIAPSSPQLNYSLVGLPGSSGSPVYNSSQQIMGVNWGSGVATRTNKGIYNMVHYWAFYDPYAVKSIEFIDPPEIIEVGTYRLSYKINPENATNSEVTWSSSNPEVATIDQEGNLTALTVGETTVQVKLKDSDIQANVTITVIPEKIRGIFGTVPWEWEEETQTIIFNGGVFPETSSTNNIRGLIENKVALNGKKIKKIVFTEPVEAAGNSSNLFYSLNELEYIENLGYLDTSNVYNMRYMFKYSRNIKELDVSRWDTSSVTQMNYMFENMSSLEQLDVSKWNMGSIVSTSYMFRGVSALRELDVSKWDMSSASSMSSMFEGMKSLQKLDVGQWNVSSGAYLVFMFDDVETVKELDLSSWDMSNSTIRSMFTGMKQLESLTLGEQSVIKDTGLSENTAAPYSGRWVSSSKTYNSSKDFMDNFEGK